LRGRLSARRSGFRTFGSETKRRIPKRTSIIPLKTNDHAYSFVDLWLALDYSETTEPLQLGLLNQY
jgi:hypothetical protein